MLPREKSAFFRFFSCGRFSRSFYLLHETPRAKKGSGCRHRFATNFMDLDSNLGVCQVLNFGWIALHPPGSSPAMHFWQILVQLHAALAVHELQPSLAMHFHPSV